MANEGKYVIHATIKADGTVARKDVVGAIFGQTEGLLSLIHISEPTRPY